jgi:hypothetical protein
MASKTPRDTVVLAVRMPKDLANAVKQVCLGSGKTFSALTIDALQAVVSGRLGSATFAGATRAGWDEGRRAGWHAANTTFHEALAAASAKLKTLAP